MRDKHLLRLVLALNVALAACFVIYLFLSANNQPRVTSSSFAAVPVGTNALSTPDAPGTRTNSPSIASNQAVAIVATKALAETISVAPQPVLARKKFGWEQLESDEYKTYLDSLRAVGCPEDKIRYIVITDINELFSKKRLKEAVTHDIQWWRSEPEPSIAGALQQKGRGLEEDRRALVEKYLGTEAAEMERGEAMLWSNVQLTGPVLGSLPPEVHNTVQEICGRSIERHQGAFWARVNEGQPLNNVEMARLREQTRADLRKVLNSDGMEEFLLRYSHNAHQLRSELRGFDPTPDEFRKIFRGIDTFEHQLQIEFGGLETLSPQQRERHLAQREAAIKEALGPKRYQDFLMIKDPLFRQAQATAMQYGAPAKVILPIYQAAKANELKRQRILSDAALTPQQKSEALQAVNQEQQRSVQQIVTDVRNRQ